MTGVRCLALLLLLLGVAAGCYDQGTKLYRNRDAVRTSLQDINNVLSGYVSLYAPKEIQVTRDSVQVWIALLREPRNQNELKFTADTMCQHVVDTLDGMDISPERDKVTITVHVVSVADAAAQVAEPADFATSSYDPATDQVSFRAPGQ